MLEFSKPLAQALAGYALSSPSKENVCIVTPRRRLARQIKEVVNTTMQDKLSHSPKIMTINDWLGQLGEELLIQEQTLMMNSLEASLIWSEALDKIKGQVKLDELAQWDMDDSAMKQSIIAQAQDAWRKIHLYNLNLADKAFAKETITNFFNEWANAYRNICMERKLCDEYMLITKLFAAVKTKDKQLKITPSLWVGFSDIYPLYEKFYELIEKQGAGLISKAAAFKTQAPVATDKTTDKNGHGIIEEYENDKDELVDLADKVKAFATENPTTDIGVVIPGLEQNWHKVRQVFTRSLQGATDDSTNSAEDALDEKDLPFDMSWGEELQEFPLIGSLLDLLELTPQRVPPSQLLDRFNSPYLTGHKKEAIARRRLDSKLCMMSTSYKEVSLADLVTKDPLPTAKATSAANLFAEVPLLRACLGEYFKVEGGFAKSANPRQWARVLAQQIYALGWGDIHWSHLERQLWDKLQALLDGLQAAGSITDTMTREEAVAFMKLQAGQIFQPSPSPSKIKLLGISEVAGLGFGRVFAARMDSTCIPQERINFFIPFALAKLAKLVGRDSHREKEQAILTDLRRAAPAVTLSYAKVVGDEDRLPHPLLDNLQKQAQVLARRDGKDGESSKELTKQMELLYDAKVTQVGDKEQLGNLVGIVKSYAACPFQALMAHRILPAKLREAQEEISQAERGTLLHKILRDLWDRLKDKDALDKLIKADKDEFKQKVASSVTKALDEQRGVFLRDDMTYELEEQLLCQLTESLVLFEYERTKNFKVVAAEKKDQVIMGGRKFEVKIDRIDLLKDEEGADNHILIDYKLSNRKFIGKYMRGDRPEEPQLIIYSLLGGDDNGNGNDNGNDKGDDNGNEQSKNKFRSLGFITLQPKDKENCLAEGLAISEDGLFYNSKDSISAEELAEMQTNVKIIYDNFIKGRSQVDPRNNDACSRCDFSAVCRVGETLLQEQEVADV